MARVGHAIDQSYSPRCPSRRKERNRMEKSQGPHSTLPMMHDAWEIPTAIPRRGNPPQWYGRWGGLYSYARDRVGLYVCK